MPEESSFNLVNIGKLSQPIDSFINKIASATGTIWEPCQIVRVAKAEKEAALIKAKGKIEVLDLQKRAISRLVDEEALKQLNMEQITEKATHHLEENASPSNMENDWVSYFFEKCRHVSDAEMQDLWAKLLAGEANKPGGYSKRLVRIVADLDKSDAELFQLFCSFGCIFFDEFLPLVYFDKFQIYHDKGVDLTNLVHLETLGLIKIENQGYQKVGGGDVVKLKYFDKVFEVTYTENDKSINVGNVMVTKAGAELAKITNPQMLPEFFEFLVNNWSAEHVNSK